MLTYLLQASICWGAFYLLYHVLFRKNTFFTLNRFYLIFSLLMGLLLPLSPVQQQLSSHEIIVEQSYDMPMVIISGAAEMIHQTEQISLPERDSNNLLLFGLYGLGVLVLGFRYFYGISQIFSLYRSGKKVKKSHYTLIRTKRNHPPFSFFRFLFYYKESAYEAEDKDRIYRHEEAHIYGLHSFDIQFIELLKIIFWPSIILLFYSRSLKTVHEYLADAAVLKNEIKKKQYGQLLIRQLQSGPLLAAAHYFTHSQLKKRLIMMTKAKTNRQYLYVYLLAIPLLSLFTLAFSLPSGESVLTVPAYLEQEVDQLPIFNGCEQEATLETQQKCSKKQLISFMIQHLQYPEAAKAANAEGMVVVRFTVDKDGMTRDAEIVKHGSHGMDEAALEVVNKIPKWTPAMKDGKSVATQLSLPFTFKFPPTDPVYEEVDEMPRFPGCEDETTPQARKYCAQKGLFSYIFSNLTYPEVAKKEGIEGVVVTSFVVNTEGKLEDITIDRPVHESLDNVVLKLVESMNQMEEAWIPGQKDGQKVNVRMKLPIKFQLDDNKEDEDEEKEEGQEDEEEEDNESDVDDDNENDNENDNDDENDDENDDNDVPHAEIAQLQLQNYQLTPNHSQHSVFLSFRSSSTENVSIKFIDIQGRVIAQYNGDCSSGSFERDFSLRRDLKGTIIVQIQQGQKIFTDKLIMI